MKESIKPLNIQSSQSSYVYWFRHYHGGDTWLDGYPASHAFEALMIARDSHSDKTNVWIELVDWNDSTLH